MATSQNNNLKSREMLWFPDRNSFESYFNEILGAQVCIDVCVFYFTSSQLERAIKTLIDKKVHVRILTGRDTPNFCKLSSVAQMGAEVRRIKNTMHHKFCTIDYQVVLEGSLNWTWNGINQNHENVTIYRDVDIAQEFQDKFDSLYQYALPFTQPDGQNIVVEDIRHLSPPPTPQKRSFSTNHY